jgi:hypothetical protein
LSLATVIGSGRENCGMHSLSFINMDLQVIVFVVVVVNSILGLTL